MAKKCETCSSGRSRRKIKIATRSEVWRTAMRVSRKEREGSVSRCSASSRNQLRSSEQCGGIDGREREESIERGREARGERAQKIMVKQARLRAGTASLQPPVVD
eukprot:2999110-Pleurochrysis_carterae.AAC.3